MADTGFHIGCAGFAAGRPRRRYFEQLDAVELEQTFVHPPRAATLRRWRKEAPPKFQFVVKAWQLVTHLSTSPSYRQLPPDVARSAADAGHLRDNELVQRALERSLAAAELLDAAALLFEMPADFTPSPANRRAVTRFFERCPRGLELVWSPSGLWVHDEVLHICDDLDLTPAWDPFEQELTAEDELPRVYLRPRGLGASHSYAEDQLLRLLEQLGAHGGYCVFAGHWLFDQARQLRGMVRGSTST